MLLHQILKRGSTLNPDKTALVCRDRSLTHAQLAEAVATHGAMLAALGVGHGDRVALFMKNSVDMAILYLACFHGGVVAVPLNTRYKADEAEYALNLTGARVAFADQELAPILRDAMSQCPDLERCFEVHEGRIQGLSGEKPPAARAEDAPASELSPDDPAAIMFTSGSTGSPKGVVHTQSSMGCAVQHKIEGQDLGPDEVGLVGSQISHVGGLIGVMLPTLSVGGTCVMIHDFEPAEYIRLMKRYRPTLVMLLPTELLEVLEHPHAKDADFSHIHSMLVGGDAVPHHTYELYRSLVGRDLMEGFGMTECEGCCLQPRHAPKKPGSIGKPVPGVHFRLVDQHGQDVPDNKVGEIWLHADSMCAGYWQNPEATAEAIHDGWLRTGDLARRDGDGYYHFVSRIKELIVRGGSNISPVEVENVLDDHPAVEVCGVVGFPDAHWGQVVGAFVEPASGVPRPTPEELRAYAAKTLADYMIPETWIFVDLLPKNPVGKVDRHGLHVLAAEAAEKRA